MLSFVYDGSMARSLSQSSKRSEWLVEQLERKILSGDYSSGSKLNEVELAAEFGVSRTPVREALTRLGSLGLVEVRPRRGAIVPEVSVESLTEKFEVMAELEALCGRLSARRIAPAEMGYLFEAHHACEAAMQAGDPNAYYELNEVFHQRIYAASRNRFLEEQALVLQKILSPYRRLQLRSKNRVAGSFNEHCGIVDAIANGDSESAARLLREHVLVQGEKFTDLVSSLRKGHAAD